MLSAAGGWALGFGYALDRLRGRAWPVVLAAARALRARRAAVPRLLRLIGEPTPSMSSRKRRARARGSPAELGASIRAGFAAIAFGSEGRMNAGSTTTAGSPGRGEAGRPGERVVAVELPLELEARRARRRGRRAPRRRAAARCRARSRGRTRPGRGSRGSRPGGGSRASRRRSRARSPSRAAPSGFRARGAGRRSRRGDRARGRRPSARGTCGPRRRDSWLKRIPHAIRIPYDSR